MVLILLCIQRRKKVGPGRIDWTCAGDLPALTLLPLRGAQAG